MTSSIFPPNDGLKTNYFDSQLQDLASFFFHYDLQV